MASDLLHVVDASTPPAKASDLPKGTVGVLGYLGPVNMTPHVWTLEEWDRFRHLLQMGIWVADFKADPIVQAKQAAEAAHALGWFKGDLRGILLDFEAVSDPAWVGEMGLKLREDGYVPLGYESAVVLNANPRLDGIVVAKWDNRADVPAGQLLIGHQYAHDIRIPSGGNVDLDVFDSSAKHLFGRGPRK